MKIGTTDTKFRRHRGHHRHLSDFDDAEDGNGDDDDEEEDDYDYVGLPRPPSPSITQPIATPQRLILTLRSVLQA